MATEAKFGDADDGVLRIDCGCCVLEGTAACVDCVVSYVVGHDEGTALVVSTAEARTLRSLERVGLTPGLRHRPRQPV